MGVNHPYEEETGILPKIVMGGILASGAYASYKVYNGEGQSLVNTFTSVLDKVAPKTKKEMTEAQKRVDSVYNTLREKSAFASMRKDITYKNRERQNTEAINRIKSAGEIKDLQIDEEFMSSIRQASGISTFGEIGISRLKEVTDIAGNQVGGKILEGLGRLHGVKLSEKDVSFEGTNMIVNINGESVKIPTAKYDKSTGAWINRSDNTYKVAPEIRKVGTYGGEGRNLPHLTAEIYDPNLHIAQVLNDTGSALYHANEHSTGRDIVEFFKGKRSESADAARTIKREIENMSSARMAITDFSNMWQIKGLMKRLGDTYLQTTPNDYAQTQRLGRTIVPDRYSMMEVEWSRSELDGLAEPVLSLNKLTNVNNRKVNVTKEALDANATFAEDIRNFPDLPLLHRAVYDGGFRKYDLQSIGALKNKDVADNLRAIQRFIGYDLGQTQSALGRTTYIGTLGHGHAVDSLKSQKGMYFATDPMTVPYSRTGANVNTVIDPAHRSTPLIWNKAAAEASPHAYSRLKDRGTMNVLAILDDRAEEVIELRPRIARATKVRRSSKFTIKQGLVGDGLPEEAMIDVWLEGAAEAQQKSLGSIVEEMKNGAFDFNRVNRIEINPGKILGITNNEGLVTGSESVEYIMGNKEALVKSKHKWIISKDELLNMKTGKNGITFFGEIEENALKVGDTAAKLRGAMQVMTPEYVDQLDRISKNAGLNFRPEAAVSRDYFKKTLLTYLSDSGSYISGKNRNEILTFMQESIAGHLMANDVQVGLTGNLKDTFSKYLTETPGSYNGNLTHLELGGHLQFDQNIGTAEEQMDTFTRVLGGIRKGITEGKKHIAIGDDFSYEKAAEFLNGDLANYNKENNPWLMRMGLSVHEGPTAQGIGSNIYNIGYKDWAWEHPELIEELATRNLVDTGKLMTEGELMMHSLRGEDISKTLQELDIPILDKEGIEKMLGDARGRSIIENIKDPYVFKDTFLSKDINPNGFAVKREDGSLVTFGSAEYYGGGQFLSEDQRLALQAHTLNEVRALGDAAATGTLPESSFKRLATSREMDYIASKRRNAMQIEDASYSINLGSSELLNNTNYIKRIYKDNALKEIAGGEEFKGLFGHMTLINRSDFKNQLQNTLDTAREIAEHKGIAVSDVLAEQFGKGHQFEEYVKQSHGTAVDAASIAEAMTKKSENAYSKIKSMIESELENGIGSKIKDVNEMIRKEGLAMITHRYPNISEQARSLAFGFATSEQFGGADKGISLGHLLRTNLNADNDGDKIFNIMMYSKKVRELAAKEVIGAQKLSAEYMDVFKNRKILDQVYGSANKVDYQFPRTIEQAKAFSKSLGMTERESSEAAFLTKAVTGSANIRANEIRSALLDKALNNGLEGEDLSHAISFAMTLPGQRIEQRVISSKDAQILINGENKLISAMHHITGNVGNVTKDQFVGAVKSLQGDVGPIQFMAALNAIKSHSTPDWLSANHPDSIVPQLRTLMDLGTRKVGEEEYKAFHSVFGNGDTHEKAWAGVKAWQEANATLENTVAVKRGIFKASVWDTLTDVYGKNFKSASESFEGIVMGMRSMKFKNDQEWIAEVSRRMTSSHLLSELQTAPFLNNLVRATSMQQVERRVPIMWSAMTKKIGQMQIKPRHVAGGAGIALAAFTALNLVSGDGTPDDINDVPSVNNPSFEGPRYNQMMQSREMGIMPNNNVSMGLLTDSRQHFSDTMGNISAMQHGRSYNSVAIRSDGTDPYKSTMYNYNQ